MKKYYDLALSAEEIDETLAQVAKNTKKIENLESDINIDEIVFDLDELINLWDDNET